MMEWSFEWIPLFWEILKDIRYILFAFRHGNNAAKTILSEYIKPLTLRLRLSHQLFVNMMQSLFRLRCWSFLFQYRFLRCVRV